MNKTLASVHRLDGAFAQTQPSTCDIQMEKVSTSSSSGLKIFVRRKKKNIYHLLSEKFESMKI